MATFTDIIKSLQFNLNSNPYYLILRKTKIGRALLEKDIPITETSIEFIYAYLSATKFLRRVFFYPLSLENKSLFDVVIHISIILKNQGLLTIDNLGFLITHPQPDEMYWALLSLKKANLLTQENCNRLKYHPEFEDFSWSIRYLNDANILTPENWDALNNHIDPVSVSWSLYYLSHVKLVTQKNLDILNNHTEPNSFAFAIRALAKVNNLNQNNFNLLLEPRHHILLSDWAIDHLWTNQLFLQLTDVITNDHFNQIFSLARGIHPEKKVFNYVDQLIVKELLNHTQSTHAKSVHQSASNSAIRLLHRYHLNIYGSNLDKSIHQLMNFIKALPNNSIQNRAAKHCISRIKNDNFTDLDSQVTTRELLALCFLAIHDADNRLCLAKDAENLLIEGLYEIQRGYNLSEEGSDNQEKKDRSICQVGTFNKLIEKLAGIHSDCEILYLTQTTATLKLPKVILEEFWGYLNNIATTKTIQELQAFAQLIDDIKANGLGIIWDNIKDCIAERMFDEFGSLFQSQDDTKFTGFIDAGQDIDLDDLPCFQKQVQISEGYHQYLSCTLSQNNRFFSRLKPEQSNPPNRLLISNHAHVFKH